MTPPLSCGESPLADSTGGLKAKVELKGRSAKSKLVRRTSGVLRPPLPTPMLPTRVRPNEHVLRPSGPMSHTDLLLSAGEQPAAPIPRDSGSRLIGAPQ